MAMIELFSDTKACWPSLLNGIGKLGIGEMTVPLVVALGHQLVSMLAWNIAHNEDRYTYPEPVGM
jgi:hypothetical protein